MSLPDPYYQDNYVTIYHGDCREILPELPKVDLVLTDPPYLKDFLWAYDLIGRESSRLLKDGGFVYAYCGAEFLPQTIPMLIKYLRWFWLYNIKHNQGHPRMWNKHLMVTSKPVLCFTNGKPSDVKWSAVDYVLENKSKEFHKWGQDCGFGLQHIELRTNADATILDPFLGSGTTTYCAKKLNRKCIGIEIEEKYCEIAAKRCSQGVFELNI